MLEPLPKDAANLLRRMLHRDPLTRCLNAANSTDDKGKVLLSMIAQQGSKSGAKKPAHLDFLWKFQRGLLQPSAWKTHTWRLYGTGAQPEESYRCRRHCRVRSQGFATQNRTSCLLLDPRSISHQSHMVHLAVTFLIPVPHLHHVRQVAGTDAAHIQHTVSLADTVLALWRLKDLPRALPVRTILDRPSNCKQRTLENAA